MAKVTMAKCALRDSAGKILILFRSGTHPRHAHDMDISGGMVEEGESPEEAIVREVCEETQLSIAAGQCRYITAVEDERRLGMLYVATLDEKEPAITLSWEHEAYAWLTAEAIKKTLSSDDAYMSALVDGVVEDAMRV